MGYRLANVVSATWSHLPGREFKVLMRMALMALDKPNAKGQYACIYYGGWETLSMALARDVPEEDLNDSEVTKRRKALCHEVTKITTALVDAGALRKPTDKARRGHQQSWVMTLS